MDSGVVETAAVGNEGGVDLEVTGAGAVAPFDEGIIGDPDAHGGEVSGWGDFADFDEAFAGGGICWEGGGDGGLGGVEGEEVEGDHRLGGLGGDGCGVEAIACVGHDDLVEGVRGVEAVAEAGGGDAIGVVNAGADGDGLADLREERGVGDFGDGGAGVGAAKVYGAGGTDVGGDGEGAGCFEPAAIEAEEDVWVAGDPAAGGAESDGGSGWDGGGEGGFDEVGEVAVVGGDEVQGSIFSEAGAVGAEEFPASGIGIEGGICDAVLAVYEDFDVIDDGFAFSAEHHEEAGGGGGSLMAEVEEAGVL